MLRDLVLGQGCEAGPSGAGNAFGSFAQNLLHGSASKSLQTPLELPSVPNRTSDANNHTRVRCRTSIVARHFALDEVPGRSPVPVVTGTDDAKLSAFLPTSHIGWAEEFNVAGPSSEQMSRNSTESWVTGFLGGGQETSSGAQAPLEMEEVWKASIDSGQRMAEDFAMEGAWQSTVAVQEDLETAWRSGKQTDDWAEEFEDDATRRERDAPLNDPDAISWVAEYNGSLLERHRAQPLGSMAHQLIADLRLSSLLPHDSKSIDQRQAAVEAAVLQTPLAEGLRDLARFRSQTGDTKGATLAVERLVELGAADADTLRLFLLSCAPDLSPQDVLRYVGPGLLGFEPCPPTVSPPAATDILAELQERACSDVGRADPSVHFTLGLVLERVCTRPDLAVQHYRHALGLLSSKGPGRKDDDEKSATQQPLLRSSAAAFIALAAGPQDSESINEALQMAPSAPVTWAALARQQSAMGNWPTAARCALRAAVSAGPEAPRFWEGLAITLCALGRDDLAHVVLLGREQLAGSGSSDTSVLESEVLGELKRMAR